MHTCSRYLKSCIYCLSLQSREPRTEVSIAYITLHTILGLTRLII
jgi:hypothetical protein